MPGILKRSNNNTNQSNIGKMRNSAIREQEQLYPSHQNTLPLNDEEEDDLMMSKDDSSGAGSSGVDETSSNSGSASNRTSSQGDHNNGASGVQHLSNTETRLVNRSKAIVYLSLLVAAAIVSTITYLFLSKEQENTMNVEVIHVFFLNLPVSGLIFRGDEKVLFWNHTASHNPLPLSFFSFLFHPLTQSHLTNNTSFKRIREKF